jgi:uncharacterized membrane protein HdeD (DUF308 family)
MDVQIKKLTKFLDVYYVKLPALPKGATDFIVSIAPWLALVFGVLAILSGVAAFGFLSVLSPFAAVAGAGQYAFTGLLAAAVLVAQGVVELLAFPSLKSRKAMGWSLMFLSLLLSVVSSIFYLSVFGVVQSLIGVLIGYYFLYQVKSYYK